MPTISEIAEVLGAVFHGDGALEVSSAAEPAAAGTGQLALAMSPAYAEGLAEGEALAAVVWPGADWQALGLKAAIEAPRARLALSKLTSSFAPQDAWGEGIHPTAAVDPTAEIGADCSIGPFTCIGPGAVLGAGSRVASHVTIGAGAVLGRVHIHAGVRIQPRVQIGSGVVIQPGAVIGSDGFSFVTESVSGPERVKQGEMQLDAPEDGAWHKIESLGAVIVADDVEIGANACIDSGTIRPTSIGRGTKIDNLVHIGHNVVVGEDCLLCGQVGIAGSVTIGNRVVLAGQVGVGDHHFVGDDVVAGGATKIMSNVPAGRVMLGYPAQRMDKTLDGYKTLRRLTRKPVQKS